MLNLFYRDIKSIVYHSPTVEMLLRGAYADSKVRGANMGPIWVLSAPDGPHVGPMNLAVRVCTRYPSESMPCLLLTWRRKGPGPCLNIKTVSHVWGIPMLKIRRSRDRVISNMGIHFTGKTTSLYWDGPQDINSHGPLTRYVKLRAAQVLGMPWTFSPPPTSNETAS